MIIVIFVYEKSVFFYIVIAVMIVADFYYSNENILTMIYEFYLKLKKEKMFTRITINKRASTLTNNTNNIEMINRIF